MVDISLTFDLLEFIKFIINLALRIPEEKKKSNPWLYASLFQFIMLVAVIGYIIFNFKRHDNLQSSASQTMSASFSHFKTKAQMSFKNTIQKCRSLPIPRRKQHESYSSGNRQSSPDRNRLRFGLHKQSSLKSNIHNMYAYGSVNYAPRRESVSPVSSSDDDFVKDDKTINVENNQYIPDTSILAEGKLRTVSLESSNIHGLLIRRSYVPNDFGKGFPDMYSPDNDQDKESERLKLCPFFTLCNNIGNRVEEKTCHSCLKHCPVFGEFLKHYTSSRTAYAEDCL